MDVKVGREICWKDLPRQFKERFYSDELADFIWVTAFIQSFLRPRVHARADQAYTRTPLVALVKYKGKKDEINLEYVVLGYDDRVCYHSDIGYTKEWDYTQWKPVRMYPELPDYEGGYGCPVLFPGDANYSTPEVWEGMMEPQGTWSFTDTAIYEEFAKYGRE